MSVVLGAGVALDAEPDVWSRHPNQPGVSHTRVLVGFAEVLATVDVIVLAELDSELLLFEVVVVSSRHPNQPGVLHVEVDVLLLVCCVLELVLVFMPPVVLSSRHPNHPGVLHVSVLVLVCE